MITTEQKKEAIRKFKERKPLAGVYAVRCPQDGRTWVGSTRNVDAVKNAVFFSLRLGSHRERSLQEAWNAYGEAAFEFQALETLESDVEPMLVSDLLKEAKQRWMWELSATGLL